MRAWGGVEVEHGVAVRSRSRSPRHYRSERMDVTGHKSPAAGRQL